MSKINAVRFINLNYNNNSIRVSDETLYFNGESTLVSLQNGGGKTVLVQMMTAPFVHKQYRNTKERPFAGYFTTPRPTFLLVEWELEHKAGYLLTGMMVRQNQRVEDGPDTPLEMVNFISAYQEPCLHDIHHLPVVEKKKGELCLKAFGECRRLFEEYKKDSSRRFFCYDMNQSVQSRQYFDKLTEYGINYKEWETIIRRINMEESGLSKLFSDCRDEKGLIEKWFLEAVENKLNRSHNRMGEFRSIMEKYIRSYWSNLSKIQQKDNISRFEEEAHGVQECIDRYIAAEENEKDALNRIIGMISVLDLMLQESHTYAAEERDIITSLEDERQRMAYEEASLDYYQHEALLQEHTQRLEQLHQKIEHLKEEQQSWETKLHMLQCAQVQERLDADTHSVMLCEQRIQLCRQESADLQPEQDYLGYVLHQYAQEQEAEADAARHATQDEIAEITLQRIRQKEMLLELERKSRSLSRDIGKLESELKGFDKDEKRYCQRFGVSLIRTLEGVYEDGLLSGMAQRLGKH